MKSLLIIFPSVLVVLFVAAISAISAYKEGYDEGYKDCKSGLDHNPYRPVPHNDPEMP